DFTLWLVGVVASPLLVLVLGPRLAALWQTCAVWLAGLNARLVAWRHRHRPTGSARDWRLPDPPGHDYSIWQSLRCLGINALSLPVHAATLLVFPLTIPWAAAHSRLLGWALAERFAAGPRPEPGRRSGYGLVGMQERVRALGGTLTTGPDDAGGFRVLAVLPLDPAPSAPAAVDTETETAPTDRPARPDQEDSP
ncbi:MAG: hypothetical protein LBU50_07280, partial [Cellulomonas sp.]|nr:hypothetical protein [Cellulomonas sp.]